MEKAKQRQIEAGKLFGEKHPKKEVLPNSEEPLEEDQGNAIEIAAKKVGLGKDTLWKENVVVLNSE